MGIRALYILQDLTNSVGNTTQYICTKDVLICCIPKAIDRIKKSKLNLF